MSVKRIPNNSKNRLSKVNDFEKDRHCLLEIYHSKIQTHAGYIIAIAIGSFALLSSQKYLFPVIVVDVILSLLLGLVAYQFFRINYWTKLSNYVIKAQLTETETFYSNYCSQIEKKYEKRREQGKKVYEYNLKVAPYTFRIERKAIDYFENVTFFKNAFLRLIIYVIVISISLVCFLCLNTSIIYDLFKVQT